MGAFILGILVGWLAEWLFYTFMIKPNKGDECESVRSELRSKERVINKLQSELEEVKKAQTEAASKPMSVKEALAAPSTKTTTQSAKTATSTTKKPASTTKKAPAAKKSTATKKAPAKKAPAKRKTTAKKGDDFTKLSGIGPSMSATLKDLGIDTFSKLASTDDDILRDMLEASGARMNNNKEVMDSWNEQATLAANGEFEALKKMQQELKK